MSDKIKHRQEKLPKRRNLIVKDMITRAPETHMRDRREHRAKDAKNHWSREQESSY